MADTARDNAKPRHRLRKAALVAFLALVAVASWFAGSRYDEIVERLSPPEPELVPIVLHPAPGTPAPQNPWLDGRSDAITDGTSGALPIYVECARLWTYSQVYDAYVHSRVIPIPARDGQLFAFGPWEAERDEHATEASNEGLLTEWQDNYYIAHDWTDYGQTILMITPGDTVTVNGREVTIEGIFEYPKLAYDEEIRWVTGQKRDEDIVILQTCVPESERNRFAYGK